jgi:hypothetical protein
MLRRVSARGRRDEKQTEIDYGPIRLFHRHTDTAKNMAMGAEMGTCWVVLMVYDAR